MTIPPPITTKQANLPKALIVTAAAWVAFVAAIYFFISKVAYSDTMRFIDIYVPAKRGGKTYFTDADEFQTLSLISLGIALAFALLVVVLVARKKYTGATITTLVFSTTVGLYGAVILGNGFYSVWGDAWFVAGIAISLLVGFGLQMYVIWNAKAAGVKLGKPKA